MFILQIQHIRKEHETAFTKIYHSKILILIDEYYYTFQLQTPYEIHTKHDNWQNKEETTSLLTPTHFTF